MSEEKILTADEILAADDMRPVKVPCPEWGGSVLVRPLASWEQDEWEVSVAESKEEGKVMPDQFKARLALKCMVTPGGSQLFAPAQLKALSQKSAAPVVRVVNKVLEISGMSKDAAEQAEKNSDAAPAGSSGSN